MPKTRQSTSRNRKRTNRNVPAKGRLRQMADTLWSVAVKADWANKCAVCGRTDVQLHSHHLIPRQWYATRYNLMNGIALCASHHQFDADISPHQNAEGWTQWLAAHHAYRATWYQTYVFEGHHRILVTKNNDYFCNVIRGLKKYVEEEEYQRIVGVRFSAWLDEQED